MNKAKKLKHCSFFPGFGGGGGGGRPFSFSDPSRTWRFPVGGMKPFRNPSNGRRRSLDSVCSELRRQFVQSNNNIGSPESNKIFENLKNFPLQLPNAPGTNNFGNLPNLINNPLLSPNFAASKSVENFENTADNNLLSPDFSASNNFDGDNALFGGGNNLDILKNDLGNTNNIMSSAFDSRNLLGNNNGLVSNSRNLQLAKGNNFNPFKDNIEQKDGPIGDPMLSNFAGGDGEDGTPQIDQSRFYASNDDMFGQYDSSSNYNFPNSYYDNDDASRSWTMEDYSDYTAYRRFVFFSFDG